METAIIHVDAVNPDPQKVGFAAALLRQGKLVAFPTETVYGLGANALDVRAVQSIFAAKGRPPTNPVIVHVADIAAARALVADWPDSAELLARRFWPGPLSIILPRADCIPDVVTAGMPTVAVRVPAHPVALALLRAAGIPIAAPSANRSTQLSPTTAQHVLSSLDGRIPLILDAGPTSGGIESTVIDLSSAPRVLRPGLVAIAELQSVLGTEVLRPPAHVQEGEPYSSPGQMQRHYAPRTPLETVEGDASTRLAELGGQGVRVALIVFADRVETTNPSTFVLPTDPARASSGLYALLHGIDTADFDRIVVQMPANEPTWLAIRDRLRRASAK